MFAPDKQQRRELLDFRGYIAQLSVLVVICAIRIYQTYSTATEGAVKPRTRRREQSWWDRPPFPGWTETRRQYAVCLIWLGWLLGLSAWKTGDDYLHLTKALGQIGMSQLPMQVLLSPALYFSTSKPGAPSIISSLTSLPQPFLNPYHRLCGRLVFAPLLLGHAILYFGFFLQSSSPRPEFSSLLAKRLRDPDVQWGIGAVWSVVLVIFVLTRPFGGRGLSIWLTGASAKDKRQRFYIAHVALVGVFCLAAYAHVAQAQTFVLETVGCFGINVVWSLWCC